MGTDNVLKGLLMIIFIIPIGAYYLLKWILGGIVKICVLIFGSLKTNIKIQQEGTELATVIGAGRYIFGEDIPMGKYNLEIVSGNGYLYIQDDEDEDDEQCWVMHIIGVGESKLTKYSNLRLRKGWGFAIEGNVQVKISKAKMLEIE